METAVEVVCLCVCAHMFALVYVCVQFQWTYPLKGRGQYSNYMPHATKKTSVPGMGYFFLSCWSVGPHRPPKYYKLSTVLLVTVQNLMVRPYLLIHSKQTFKTI